MSIFRKEKDDNDYEDEEDLIDKEAKDTKKFGKKFKDLKPVNKKKRKEPPKPWGKKERYTVFVILAVTILVAFLLATLSQNSVKIEFGKPSGNFDFSQINPFKEKVIIIEKK